MYFGVDYYPEHWPEERWPLDAKMMREAKINIVRLAEFAWAKMEPEDGRFDFSWLDRAIGILAGEGIKVVLGTPTAAAPKWLMDKHPDAYPKDLYGLKKGFGTRRHYCPTNKAYREYSARITRKMAEHFKENPDIVAWQTDNEFGAGCYCDNCHKSFQEWLKKKYKTIDVLNEEYGTVFWSQTYRSFKEVPGITYSSSDGFSQNAEAGAMLSTPFNHNPGLVLDYHRFFSDAIAEFQKIQIDEIRKLSNLPITHNYMGHYSELDYYNLGKDLDFISWDCYPDNMWGKASYQSVSMAHDLMRGIKRKKFWVMEQQSGPCGWHAMGDTPEPGQIRLWTYQSIAHGAEAVLYFRWRACTFGIEQYWYGILDHDGIGRRRYREIQETGTELTKLSDIITGSDIKNEVVLIKSYDHVWSHRGQPHNLKFNYNGLLGEFYRAFLSNNVTIDVTSDAADFSAYKMVVLPAYNMVTEEFGKKCEEYVENGGVLIITFRSGTRTWNNRMTTLTSPGYFKDIAGIELEEFDSLNFGRTVKITGEFGEGTASVWCDILKSNGAEPIAFYDSHYYRGTPAVTVNTFGRGKVYYIGCDLDSDAADMLIRQIITREGIKTVIPRIIPGVEAVKRVKDGKTYLFILNHNNKAVDVPIDRKMVDELTGSAFDNLIQIQAYGVAVLTEIPC